jgi:hypothetical protein
VELEIVLPPPRLKTLSDFVAALALLDLARNTELLAVFKATGILVFQ